MLGGKDFGGGHKASLLVVVKGHEHCHECHYGLPGSDITLQEAVHLPA